MARAQGGGGGRGRWTAEQHVLCTWRQGYGPNINVVKDPRYGRNSELPGEDPVLTAQYAVHYVQGMQQLKVGKGGKPVLKMLSSLKHYTACTSVRRCLGCCWAASARPCCARTGGRELGRSLSLLSLRVSVLPPCCAQTRSRRRVSRSAHRSPITRCTTRTCLNTRQPSCRATPRALWCVTSHPPLSQSLTHAGDVAERTCDDQPPHPTSTNCLQCSYFAPNGISSCGNPYLLNDRIRSAWKRPVLALLRCAALAVASLRSCVTLTGTEPHSTTRYERSRRGIMALCSRASGVPPPAPALAFHFCSVCTFSLLVA